MKLEYRLNICAFCMFQFLMCGDNHDINVLSSAVAQNTGTDWEFAKLNLTRFSGHIYTMLMDQMKSFEQSVRMLHMNSLAAFHDSPISVALFSSKHLLSFIFHNVILK